MNKSSKKLHPRDSPYASLMHPARHPGFPASFFPEQIRSPTAAFPLTPALACVLLPSRSLGCAAPRGGGGFRRAAPTAGEVRRRVRDGDGRWDSPRWPLCAKGRWRRRSSAPPGRWEVRRRARGGDGRWGTLRPRVAVELHLAVRGMTMSGGPPDWTTTTSFDSTSTG